MAVGIPIVDGLIQGILEYEPLLRMIVFYTVTWPYNVFQAFIYLFRGASAQEIALVAAIFPAALLLKLAIHEGTGILRYFLSLAALICHGVAIAAIIMPVSDVVKIAGAFTWWGTVFYVGIIGGLLKRLLNSLFNKDIATQTEAILVLFMRFGIERNISIWKDINGRLHIKITDEPSGYSSVVMIAFEVIAAAILIFYLITTYLIPSILS